MNKQYKYFPATTNIPDETNKALPKQILSYTNLELTTVPPPTFVQQPSPSYVLQTVDPTVCINTFSCPTDKFVTGSLNLLRPHVELSRDTDPFVILNHIFETYRNLQNLLQLHRTDFQTLTPSTIQLNDFLKTLVLLETLQIANSIAKSS